MVLIIIDEYLLTSSGQFVVNTAEEVRKDLILHRKPCEPGTVVTGQVTSDNIPIKNATVKILDRNYNPVEHTATVENGVYQIVNLLSGAYKITASAPGFLTVPTTDFFLKPKETRKIYIKMIIDPSREMGFIYGLITDQQTGKSIAGASVSIILENSKTLLAETSTNHEGQYLLCDILPGRYILKVRKPGCYPDVTSRFILNKGEYLKADLSLTDWPIHTSETISGLITDRGMPLKNIYVGLYKVENNSESLIQTKTTNDEGLYLFTDVKPGNYIVKAKSQKKSWRIKCESDQ